MITYISNKNMKRTLTLGCLFFLTISFSYSGISNALTDDSQWYLNKVGSYISEVGYDIKVSGNYAYMSDNDGVLIIDIEDPKHPHYVSSVVLNNGAFGLDIAEETLFIASSGEGFVMVNISDPTNHQIIGQYSSYSGAYTVTTDSDLAYVGLIGGGFGILNFSNPADIHEIFHYSDTVTGDLKVKDKILYYAANNAGIKVFNVSDSQDIQYKKTISDSYGVWDLHISNNTLYAGLHGNGIQIYDIEYPSNPTFRDSFYDSDGGEEQGVVESNGWLFVADNYGVELFDVSNPESIMKVAEYRNGVSAAHDIDVQGDFVYVAKGMGLLILEKNTEFIRYFPPYLFYLIPGGIIVLGTAIGLVIKRKRKKIEK